MNAITIIGLALFIAATVKTVERINSVADLINDPRSQIEEVHSGWD